MANSRLWIEQRDAVEIEPATGSPLAARVANLKAIKQWVASAVERLPRKARIRFAVSFAIATAENYWREIQRGNQKIWPLRKAFAELGPLSLDDNSKWIARTLGRAAA